MNSFLNDHSFVNKFLFPAPPSHYTASSFEGELLWVDAVTPCLFLNHPNSHFLVLYFHGNATDLCACYDLMEDIKLGLNVSVLAVEYPGYGVSKGKASENSVNLAAKKSFEFATRILNWPARQIIVWGRSIGSGVAVELTQQFPPNETPAALVLISAYTSIHDLVRHLVGKIAVPFVSNRFKSLDKMENVTCPTIFIHGKQDMLIPFCHSERLAERCQSDSVSLCVWDDMDHNRFDIAYNILTPIKKFFDEELELKTQNIEFQIPAKFYRVPRKSEEPHTIKTMFSSCMGFSDCATDSTEEENFTRFATQPMMRNSVNSKSSSF